MIDIYIRKLTAVGQIVVRGALDLKVYSVQRPDGKETPFHIEDTGWFDFLDFEAKRSLLEDLETALLETIHRHMENTP
jgi:hypothetical protein